MSDHEGHGHKAIVYKSYFPPLRHSVVTETPADTLANKPRLTKDQALCSLCPHDTVFKHNIEFYIQNPNIVYFSTLYQQLLDGYIRTTALFIKNPATIPLV